MSRIKTMYNPGVGISYIIENTKTGEKVKASTLTVRDADQKPWRSPKGTPEGKEFFKMKSGSKKKGFVYYKFMNSNIHTKCLSEDGIWLFTGLKPDGTKIKKIEEILRKEEVKTIPTKQIREEQEESAVPIRSITKATVANVDEVLQHTTNVREKVESVLVDEFSAADQLSELLTEKENV